jgi:hypothetical protein
VGHRCAARRQHLHPFQCPKPVQGDPLTLLRPFPGQERRRPRRNWQARAGRPPRDRIAKLQVFPGPYLQKVTPIVQQFC